MPFSRPPWDAGPSSTDDKSDDTARPSTAKLTPRAACSEGRNCLAGRGAGAKIERVFSTSTASSDTESAADFAALAGERLEAELTTLAAHLHAGMCRFLLMVAEFDRRELHDSWECLGTA